MELNIGYEFNKNRLKEMMDIINAIDYISHFDLDKKEILKILNIYG